MNFELDVLPPVLADESTCRLMLDKLLERGVQINIASKDLTHEECQEVIIQILSELKRNETVLQRHLGE